jgi:hypothetical protein
MANTWNGTASNELVSGAALTDGATATGLWEMNGDPSSAKMMTKTDCANVTTIPTGNIGGFSNNQCVTKQAILGAF